MQAINRYVGRYLTPSAEMQDGDAGRWRGIYDGSPELAGASNLL